MKRIIFTLALLFGLPTCALAQCNGVFGAGTICGSVAGGLPGQVPSTSFAGAAGGTTGQIEYNNSGVFGGFTMSGAGTLNPATGVLVLSSNVVSNTNLTQAVPGSVKCQPNSSNPSNWVDCPGAPQGFADMRPAPGQGAGSWLVMTPNGADNSAICSGTTSQCLQEFVTNAKTNNWSWRIFGPGTITTSGAIAFGTCSGRSEYIDPSVTIAFGAVGAAAASTVDSLENCYSKLTGQFQQHSGDTGPVISYVPTNTSGFGNITLAASYVETPIALSPATGGSGIRLDPTNGGFIGNEIHLHHVNGGTTCIQVVNPGTAFIAFEHNEFHLGYIHACATRVGQILTGVTNQGNVRYNTWTGGRLDPGSGAIAGWDTWEVNGTYNNLNVTNESFSATTGLVIESGANNNNFFGGSIFGTTALSDSGTGTILCGVKNITNNCIRSMLAVSAGGTTQAQNTTQFEVTIGSAGEGFVQATCPYTGTFRNLRLNTTAPAAGQTIIATWRIANSNSSITCTITGTGTSCNDLTHTAACTAGQVFALQTVTSATTGTINSIAGGIEYDYP